jgi:hypothetical protein
MARFRVDRPRAILRRDHLVERPDPVLGGVEQPRGVVHRHERVEREGATQVRQPGDPRGERVHLGEDAVEQLDRIREALADEQLQRMIGHREHHRVAGALGVRRQHSRVAPQHALRPDADVAPARIAVEPRDGLPQLGEVARP